MTEDESQPEGAVQLHVNVTRDVARAITELSARHDISATEVIRRAVSVYKFTDDEKQAGRSLWTSDGSAMREILAWGWREERGR